MLKKILHYSIFLWMTISFMVSGQQDSSAVELRRVWYANSNFVVSPFKKDQPQLTIPGDSSTYKSRNLLRMPFIPIQKTYISKDWSIIEFSQQIQGSSYKVPFVASLEWYIDKKIQINRMSALSKAIKDTSKTLAGQSQFLQDNRGRGFEVIGVNVGQLGRVSLSARGNVTVKGNLVFQDQELIRSKVSETRNTHLKFDQMQRISVEGKVGERISVNVDHDSELSLIHI